MNIKTLDKVKDRIWFWEECCPFLPKPLPYTEIQKRVEEIIKRNGKNLCVPVSYIFLVNKPFTFGHSQLVMEFPYEADSNESDRFKQAAPMIQKALCVFKAELNPKTVEKFQDLALLTLTKGVYIKTLILRTSAEENIETMYKVHLVPYFKSDADACQKRYCKIHRVSPHETGGLVGWLGERETEVDKWGLISETPWALTLNEIANTKLGMQELAKLLAKAWPPKV